MDLTFQQANGTIQQRNFKLVTKDKSLVESQYGKMEIDREIYLERARKLAELTIPHLYPPKGSNEATHILHHINQ